jgi:hypothetical protein
MEQEGDCFALDGGRHLDLYLCVEELPGVSLVLEDLHARSRRYGYSFKALYCIIIGDYYKVLAIIWECFIFGLKFESCFDCFFNWLN